MNREQEAWEHFIQTGRISDYMRYRQAARMQSEDDYIQDEEEGYAVKHPGAGDWQ